MTNEPTPSEWLRGVLELCVLRVMVDGPTYGYAIAADLATAGFGDIKGGTLYPLLARLEKNALVSVEWRTGEGGPGRKYFVLTDAGRAQVDEGLAQWQVFSTRVTGHLFPSSTLPSSEFRPSLRST
ncbi:PadR family transcriptional regulator [Agromyces badenianii]|uniref:PadR family transcriptional regulator n=1 Tax=Agromyces badenianii TaxID=2080742 RepID=A0A2S0X075_9MICO|nr:PadR family transcriptional regulator [Agromyces badenianii]AWB97027.1 PadR family transcriptional regulator [Agromyces badenianii]PWC05591.1 PadR family transcriptional regulator [Agromyces badenianii]